MVVLKLYVEGGGNQNSDLERKCRRGFRIFLEKAGLTGCMPRIVACGGRKQAYEDFCTALNNNEPAMLLVDSEAPVAPQHQHPPDKPENWQPWQHLAQRPGDQWQKPQDARDDQCHLMVQCMESWFLANRQTLIAFFGQGFNPNCLPSTANDIESMAKTNVFTSLKTATRNCRTKGAYGKGEHSFEILALIDPSQVTAASGWAKRFVDDTKRQMGC